VTQYFVSSFLDPENGLITTKQSLDREKQQEYTLIIVVQDDGSPPQKASSVLRVEVTDVDDHKPIFRRTLVSTFLNLNLI